MKLVSIYNNAFHSGTDTKEYGTEISQKAPLNLDLDIIFESIKNGLYEKSYPLAAIRAAKSSFILEVERIEELNLSKEQILEDKKYQQSYSILKKLKDKIPRFTVAGVFKPEGRTNNNLQTPSEYIDIDIDSPTNLEEIREKLIQDKYTVACFKSCGGDGLALIFKIDHKKHAEAWEGISHYLFQNYGIVLDKSHKGIANTRSVTYDPNLFFLHTGHIRFEEYLKKSKKKEEDKVNYVYAKTDFESCVQQIVGQQLDFCPDYFSYRDIGFAIANKFGLLGISYFDQVCQFNSKYDKKRLEKDYKNLCRNPDGKIKISTFFWRCKSLNLEIYSAQTKLISSVASSARKTGKSKEDVIRNLEAHEGIKKEDSEGIVNQVFDEKIDYISQDGILDEIQNFIKYNYNLKVNSITGKFENNEAEWTEEDFNSCLVDVKKVFEKADARWIERILFSSFVKKYNPIKDFFEENKHKQPQIIFLDGKPLIPEIIQRLWDSVNTRSVYYTSKFGTKWLVGAVSTWFGEPSNLELIFAGELGQGKSHFIKHLLPEQLRIYYAELKLTNKTDSEIAACQKMIINENECGGKDRKSDEEHKAFLDIDFFYIRRPFRRDPENMKRLAALFGTTNHVSDILTDRHGNRRKIVTEVLSRNQAMYDSIDKTELWMAVYALWKAGFEWKILGDEIKELNSFSSQYEEHGLEYEMICKFFEPSDEPTLTASEVKDRIEAKSQQKLRLKVVIAELFRLKYQLVEVELEHKIKKKSYCIREKIESIEPLF